ncbi:MAG: biotin/lipoyl-binding protein [Hyphomicrobium sp.]
MTPAPRDIELPEIRQDLRLEPGAPGAGGTPTWLVIDAVQHRYVQIEQSAYQLMSLWQAGLSCSAMAARMKSQFGEVVSEDDVAKFARFLADNHLTVEPVEGDWRDFALGARRLDQGWLRWLVHNYLFVRVPLFRPEPFLRRMLPLVALLYTRTMFAIVLGSGLSGLYFVSRQWDQFLSTFQHFFSWHGALTYGVALIVIKSAHELGHAFTAVRQGCRVPSMGICFLVMVPVLYTDVTDIWRLRERKGRLAVGAAGVIVELALACFATLLWVFLPEGALKSLMFSIATIGWVLSLIINLNPLMRFDGYYLFADAIGIDNLQSRAFAFARWRMREILFGLAVPPPERVETRTARILIVFGWAVWIYRFILFTGIALLVYHMAFKVLGIILFAIEIIYFILKPIVEELKVWWRSRDLLKAKRRSWLSLGVTAAALCVAIIPWSTSLVVPAVIEAGALARVYPQRTGTIVDVLVKTGAEVRAGDAIVVLKSADLDYGLSVAERKIALLQMRLARRSSDDEDRAKSLVMERELISLRSERDGLLKEREELTIRAPFDGTVVEINELLHKGRPISRAEFVCLVRGGGDLVARGYIAEKDMTRLAAGASGNFVPDAAEERTVLVTLKDVARSGAQSIELPELASLHGGPIAVRPMASDGGERRLVPVEAQYLAVLDVDKATALPRHSLRGVIHIDGEAQSFLARMFRQVASVLVRESGF